MLSVLLHVCVCVCVCVKCVLIVPLRFYLERLVLPTHLCYTFTMYPTLILGLGAMFTASYQFQAMGVNTLLCGETLNHNLSLSYLYYS